MKFDRAYYIDGAESNYINYPKKRYKGLAKDIIKVLKILDLHIVLDYGCATGNLVREFRELNIGASGVDISEWAINYGRVHIIPFLYLYRNNQSLCRNVLISSADFIISLDVFEHMTDKQLKDFFKKANDNLVYPRTILLRIPVAAAEGQGFLLDCSKKDKTHITIHSKTWWRKLFLKYGWEICKVVDEKRIYDSDGVLAWVLKRKG